MIMTVNSNLEGIVVNCTGLNSSSVSSLVLMTTIYVYNVGRYVVSTPMKFCNAVIILLYFINTDIHAPEVVIRPDVILFGNDNFTVTLEWSQFGGETYSVATVPEAVHTSFTRSTSVQLVMLYNTQYNMNITTTLCGHRNTTNFTIHYIMVIAILIMIDAQVSTHTHTHTHVTHTQHTQVEWIVKHPCSHYTIAISM